jgi:hypothetical protein
LAKKYDIIYVKYKNIHPPLRGKKEEKEMDEKTTYDLAIESIGGCYFSWIGEGEAEAEQIARNYADEFCDEKTVEEGIKLGREIQKWEEERIERGRNRNRK